jgi:transposase
VLQLSVAQVENYAHQFLCYGVAFKKAPGRPPKLTQTQKHQLAQFLEDVPAQCGFEGNCWRSPMVQPLILDKFGVYDNVFYLAE